MEGRVSDFDDIFILFMKMQIESCLMLGSILGQSLHVCLIQTLETYC